MLRLILRCVLVVAGVAATTHAATIWTGSLITYNEPGTDPTQPGNQDRLTSNVWITRASTAGIFNAVLETNYDMVNNLSPLDTEWAVGALTNYASLTYDTWANAGGGHPVNNLPGEQLVCHLKTDDIYLSVMFTYLGGHGAGGFTYNRTTPLSITNFADGATLSAPTIRIAANAAADGSVTNVAFFAATISATNLLGSRQAAPFTITASNMAPGSYSFSAIATGPVISATSDVVNVSIVSPVTITTSTPLLSSNHFSFTYSANPGLTYVVMKSSDLVHWSPISTNVPVSSPVGFIDTAPVTGAAYYRVARQANP